MAYFNGLFPSSINLQATDITEATIHTLIGFIEVKQCYMFVKIICKGTNC